MPIEYMLDLIEKNDFNRLKRIIDHHYEIMEEVNEDSITSPNGGAMMNYEITIKLKERWA